MQADKEPMLHIEKSCICGANIADRYIRVGASHAAASAMISHMGGSETDAVPKQSGTLWATTTGTHNDTPISMGRGEIPVRLAATSRLFCFKGKCKAAEPADKCLPVCSTAFG